MLKDEIFWYFWITPYLKWRFTFYQLRLRHWEAVFHFLGKNALNWCQGQNRYVCVFLISFALTLKSCKKNNLSGWGLIFSLSWAKSLGCTIPPMNTCFCNKWKPLLHDFLANCTNLIRSYRGKNIIQFKTQKWWPVKIFSALQLLWIVLDVINLMWGYHQFWKSILLECR